MRRRGSTFDHRSRASGGDASAFRRVRHIGEKRSVGLAVNAPVFFASGDGQRFGAAVLMPTVILWGKVCPLAPPLVIALIYRAVK